MKFINLAEQLNKKEKVLVIETEVTEGIYQGEKRILLVREAAKPVVLSNANYNTYKFKQHIGQELMIELNESNFSEITVTEGTVKQVRANLEDILNG